LYLQRLYEAAGGLERKPKVRDSECVALVRVYSGAPHTSSWRPGERVVESKGLRAGTAIATFVKWTGGSSLVNGHGLIRKVRTA